MSSNDTQIVLGSLRYKSSTNQDLFIQVPLTSEQSEMIESDRTIVVNSAEQYDIERQESTIFRFSAKINYIYDNDVLGTTTYPILLNNLYYYNPYQSFVTGQWSGFPQYHEFDLIRNDVNTQQVNFIPKSASTYNWNVMLSYAYENNTTKQMRYESPEYNINWVCSDGIPFRITQERNNGQKVLKFTCPMTHGLSVGEYVILNFNYNGTNAFQVDFIGDDYSNNREYVFGLIDIGYTGTTFGDGVTGTFRRCVTITNSAETTSNYYVRRHKIIKPIQETILEKAGYELNPFRDDTQYEQSAFTPNNVARISKKNNSQAYTVSFKTDLGIDGILDNQKRPISELYYSFFHRGYFGLFYDNDIVGLKEGWKFNVGTGTTWWDKNNPDSNGSLNLLNYSKTVNGNTYQFNYNETPNEGDVFDGDFCEWNNYTMIERVISNMYHKITYNQQIFNTQPSQTTNYYGFYYQPFHPTTIKVFSSYIEDAVATNASNVPTYSYFSESTNRFRWRDIYPYGVVDEFNNGVDYPYLNSAHYPFENIVFRLIPEGVNYNIQSFIITDPVIDDCE